MERRAPTPRCGLLHCALLCLSAACGFADNHVTINAWANSDYVKRREADGKPRQETYVFAAGRFYEGSTVDHSIDGLPFRKIAEYLAPELARRNYLPTQDVANADLLLIVHWGTTMPRVTLDSMRSSINPSLDRAEQREQQRQFNETMAAGGGFADRLNIGSEATVQTGFDQAERLTDDLDRDSTGANNAQLLGYTQELRHLSNHAMPTVQEATLRANLEEERYFIIIKAYEFHGKASPGQRQRPVWTLYLNMRSPGQNFKTAMTRMSAAGGNYFGRKIDGLQVDRPGDREGTVRLAPLIILGEVK